MLRLRSHFQGRPGLKINSSTEKNDQKNEKKINSFKCWIYQMNWKFIIKYV